VMQLKPVAPALGIEVGGVDLARPLDEATFKRIESAWHEGLILLFRNQDLDEAQQAAFGARFGQLGSVLHRHDGRGTHPGVMYISNIVENGKLIGALPDGEMYFHSDQCYTERPAMATMLYAMEIPSRGGNTLFANMYRAYETLPAGVKARLEDLKAWNVYDYAANPTKRGQVKADAPRYAHAMVRTHPATKRKALYVNRLMTTYVEGMPREESDELLGLLFEHTEQTQFIYEHVWRPGDLIVWDNRCTLHARTDFDASERRKLRRVAILGDVPA
jgi:alpha-ketoglutarate-dependent taurine dioxygenase